METRLLICQEAELKELNKKHRQGNAISNLKMELEELGAQDVMSLKAYSKTNGYASASVKLMYLTGEKSVVFKAEGTEEDFDNLEVYLTLSEMDARMYPFPTDELKQDFKDAFTPILDDWNAKVELVVLYWAYRSRRDSNYIAMPDDQWDVQLKRIEELRAKKGPVDSWRAELKEQEILKSFKALYANDIPSGLKTFGALNRYMYQTAEFFDLDITRKH